MEDNNRLAYILNIITIVVLALILVALLSRLFITRPGGGGGGGGGGQINPPARQAYVVPDSMRAARSLVLDPMLILQVE